ncbi:MAG: helical backbone metal receptor [Parvicellaceae bacterium]
MQFTDQLGRTVKLNDFPKRIVSLVPSQTELLFDLGLEDKVVGITKFCIHPASWFKNKQRVGGTKNINLKAIEKLKPDLIIANKEENTQSEIENLMNLYPVWVSDIGNLEDALRMIVDVGELTNTKKRAIEIAKNIKADFSSFKSVINKSAAYIIWNNPIMTINKTRFINDMLKRNGLINVFAEKAKEYPEISKDELIRANPEIILLSSEPFPFKEKHLQVFNEICPSAKVILVDGEFFSWYGSRLQKSVSYFSTLF